MDEPIVERLSEGPVRVNLGTWDFTPDSGDPTLELLDSGVLTSVQADPSRTARSVINENQELMLRHILSSRLAGCKHENGLALRGGQLWTYHGPLGMRGPADADASKDWGDASWGTSAPRGEVIQQFETWIRKVCPDAH